MNDPDIFRPAVMQDLPRLKAMYRQIVKDMNGHGIRIWDEVYPCDFLEEDIRRNRLYVLLRDGKIVSAFALCRTNPGEKAVRWKDDQANALYLDRLGVDAGYSKQGIGSIMLGKARDTAKALGADCLRLFVVDGNEPAIRLYVKNGFAKADGAFDEAFADGFALHEYGYEAAL